MHPENLNYGVTIWLVAPTSKDLTKKNDIFFIYKDLRGDISVTKLYNWNVAEDLASFY